MNTKAYKHLLFAAVLCLGAVSLTGCIDETEPTDMATQKQVDGNASAIEGLVMGIPAAMTTSYFSDRADWAFGYGAIMHIRDIFTEDLATQDDKEYNNFWFFGWNKYQGRDYAYAQYLWNYPLQIISTANTVINSIDEQNCDDASLGFLGSALCYRAMLYLDMARCYEFQPSDVYPEAVSPEGKDITGLTVPIVRGTETEEKLRNNPRATREEMFEFIKEDLDKAIEYLPNLESYNKTLPHLDVAYGLMARLYMWVENYEKAEEYARLAINAADTYPISESQATSTASGFNDINQWMWGVSITKEALWSNLANWTAMVVNETYFGYAGPSGGCDVCMDARMYNRMSDTDWRKLMYKAPAGSALDGQNIYIDDYLGYYMHEYASTKFRPGSGNTSDYVKACETNYPLMRVEEMYFIEAEAAAHQEPRRGKQLVEKFMTENRDPEYTCDPVDGNIVEEIVFQKRVELWGEGQTFFDVKRLNMPVTRAYEGTNHYPSECFNTTTRPAWMTWVIIRTEEEGNTALTGLNNPDPSDKYPPIAM